MTHRGPFQPLLFCDSVKNITEPGEIIQHRLHKAAAETPKKPHFYIASSINSLPCHSLVSPRPHFTFSPNIVQGNGTGFDGAEGDSSAPTPLCSPTLPTPRAVPQRDIALQKSPRSRDPRAERGSLKGCGEDAQTAFKSWKKILQRKELKELRLLSLSKGQGR